MHQKDRFLLKFLLIHCIQLQFCCSFFHTFSQCFFFYWLLTKSRRCANIAPTYLEKLRADYRPKLQLNSENSLVKEWLMQCLNVE